MQIKLEWTVTAILAVSAILSPIITTILNNRHLRKMRLLELKREEYKETVVYKRNVIEAYIKTAGGCIQHPSPNQRIEYADTFGSAVVYVPDEVRTKMIEIDNYILQSQPVKAHDAFILLLPQLIGILQSL